MGNTESVRRLRAQQSAEDKEYFRRYNRAYASALQRLKAAHGDEFRQLLDDERGLRAIPYRKLGRRPKGQTA